MGVRGKPKKRKGGGGKGRGGGAEDREEKCVLRYIIIKRNTHFKEE